MTAEEVNDIIRDEEKYRRYIIQTFLIIEKKLADNEALMKEMQQEIQSIKNIVED